ncbi:MAG: hypothetical protein IJ881_00630 [Neisseriaceae bacterium]|nr:hypothetical protein [Neisseriaceae bacterium]
MMKLLTHFRRYVKIIAFFICILGCAGCASKSATDSISESVAQQIVALKESLPVECQTKAIYSQIDAIESGKNSIVQSCKADIAKVEAQRDKWMVAFFAIVLVLCGFAVKRFKII